MEVVICPDRRPGARTGRFRGPYRETLLNDNLDDDVGPHPAPPYTKSNGRNMLPIAMLQRM